MQHPFIIAILFVPFLTSCKKKKEDSSLLPTVTISGVSKERTAAKSNFGFTISINKPATGTASVKYETVAGTAAANTDYTPVSGFITFNSGERDTTIYVEVTGDSLRKPNQTFFMQLSNPQNCIIQSAKGTGIIINENGSYLPVDNAGYTTPLTYPGYSMAWSDEFAGNIINAGNWSHQTGNGVNGWGNNELEYYTAEKQNSFLSDGNLIIESRLERNGNFNYTSARMNTKNKQSFRFGRVDIRAKLPIGKGLWPALWMLGNNIDAVDWPACGEIDIMEYLGHEPEKVYATLHWGASFSSHVYKGTNYTSGTGRLNDQFHVYSLIWKQDSISMLVDDIPYFAINKSEFLVNYPFNAPFFFIFNVAVGGNFPGAPDSNTTFPQRMIVDYIRVFQ